MPAIVPADPEANATDLLMDRVNATPDLALFSLPTHDGGWTDITAKEFYNQVVALAKGFVAAGIKPGDKVGLMCKTRYEWTLVDFGIWFAGAVMVPIYETSSPTQLQWNLSDSGTVAMITETAEHFARFDEAHADLPLIKNVWKIDTGDLDKIAASGTEVSDEEIERLRNLAQGKDLATLIYTAGTTGRPKGCMLTHSNFVELTRNAREAIPEVVNTESSTLLFITLAHIFARFISILAIVGGVIVALSGLGVALDETADGGGKAGGKAPGGQHGDSADGHVRRSCSKWFRGGCGCRESHSQRPHCGVTGPGAATRPRFGRGFRRRATRRRRARRSAPCSGQRPCAGCPRR